jgi:hypothetical protein
MKVFVVLDDSKSSYDAGGIFHSVHATYAQAVADISNGRGSYDHDMFSIEEEEIDLEAATGFTITQITDLQ